MRFLLKMEATVSHLMLAKTQTYETPTLTGHIKRSHAPELTI